MAADYWKSTQRNKWKFTREELADGRKELASLVPQVNYGDHIQSWDPHVRLYLFNLVQALGQQLHTRQRVLSTAHVYLLRIFTRISILEINPFLLVATAVYIASKAEELPQHIRTVSSEARLLWNDYMPPDATQIAECEFYMIDELESCLVVFHPYRSLEQIMGSMSDTQPVLQMSPEELQGVWSIVNDSYASDSPLLYAPNIIAVACLYMTLVLRPQLARPSRPPDKIKARIDVLATYLGKSAIDLEKVAECVQELVTLYAQWETYEQRQVHTKITKLLDL